MDDSLGEKEIH